MMKRIWCLLVCLAFWLPGSALADDCFLLYVDGLDMGRVSDSAYVQQYLSAQTQGLRIQKQIDQPQPVRLSLTQMDTQTLVFDKDYGYQSGLFDSGNIYLPFVGNYTVPYLVTLYVGDWVYAMPFMQLQARLSRNGACTYGAYLYDYDPTLAQDWHMGTMLNLDALRSQGIMAVDVCASNRYLLGQADIILQGDMICILLNLNPSANVEVHDLSVYLNTDCSTLTSAASGPAHGLGEWIPIGNAASALLYLPMTISYDPAGLSTYGYDLGHGYLQSQLSLWQQNRYAMHAE